MAAKTTTNYGWTEVDPDGRIDVANDVNVPLEQIDASLKTVDEKAKAYTFSDGVKESNGNVSLDVAIRKANSYETSTVENDTTQVVTAQYSHTEGQNNRNGGKFAHIEGTGHYVTGECAHAEGIGYLGSSASATGSGCHTEGYSTRATADYAHAEGYACSASGTGAHAEGDGSTASGEGSHAECEGIASGKHSHAEGERTQAKGENSHAEGIRTIASRACQHVFGKFNVQDTMGSAITEGEYVEIVGNGETDTNRKNARTLDWNGNQWTAGDVTCDTTQGSHDKLYSLRQVAAFVETLPAMEFGTSNAVTAPAVSQVTVDVTFGSAKTEAPVMFVNLQHTAAYGDLTWYVQSVTNQQASIVVVNNGSEEAAGITVDWLAISGR